MADNLIPFHERLRAIAKERGISQNRFEQDTGIARRIFSERPGRKKMYRSTIMAIAYYFGMTVEELIEGTTAVDFWYGEF